MDGQAFGRSFLIDGDRGRNLRRDCQGGTDRVRFQGEALGDWLELVLHLYGERVLPFDVAAARLAGKLMDKARATGHSPGFADVAIAATAGSHSLTVLTRNLRHFVPLGIPATDPFARLP